MIQSRRSEDELSTSKVDRGRDTGLSNGQGGRVRGISYSQFPTVPSHPVRYDEKALYFGVESIAAQSIMSDRSEIS